MSDVTLSLLKLTTLSNKRLIEYAMNNTSGEITLTILKRPLCIKRSSFSVYWHLE